MKSAIEYSSEPSSVMDTIHSSSLRSRFRSMRCGSWTVVMSCLRSPPAFRPNSDTNLSASFGCMLLSNSSTTNVTSPPEPM